MSETLFRFACFNLRDTTNITKTFENGILLLLVEF